jgi:hypothetical protein
VISFTHLLTGAAAALKPVSLSENMINPDYGIDG